MKLYNENDELVAEGKRAISIAKKWFDCFNGGNFGRYLAKTIAQGYDGLVVGDCELMFED